MLRLLVAVLFSSQVYAQKVGIKVEDVNTIDQDTTIQIKKGSVAKEPNKALYQITEGEDDIVAEPAVTMKEARLNWAKSCNEWKDEMKSLNKDNHVIALNCGTRDCSTSAAETTCRSKAKHKIKVKVVEESSDEKRAGEKKSAN